MKNIFKTLIIILFVLLIVIVGLYNLNKYLPHSPYDPEIWALEYGYEENDLFSVDFNLNRRGRLYFDILLNDAPIKAYFDTGNAFGICVNEKVMESAHYQTLGYTKAYNSEGNLTGNFLKFNIESFCIENKEFKLNSGIFTKDEYAYFGFKPLMESRITLDYKDKIAAISTNRLQKNIQSNESRTVIKFMTLPGSREGYIAIPIRIKDEEFYAMVDTGASVSVIDNEIMDHLHLKQNIFGRVKVPDMEIGNFKMTLPSVSVHSQRGVGKVMGKEIMATVGADVLCQYLVTIDYQQNIIILER